MYDISSESPSSFEQPDNDNDLRRSTSKSILPNKFNDFVISSKVKYDIEKFVNCFGLKSSNYCFATKLNKINNLLVTRMHQRIYKNWIDAMNSYIGIIHGKLQTYLVIEKL